MLERTAAHFAAAVLLCMGGCASAKTDAPAAAKQRTDGSRPNILLILGDDLGSAKHPRDGRPMEFTAALPADLQDVLDALPGWRDGEKD